MPFIDAKLTVAVTEDKKEAIKTELGKVISIVNKPESFLMVGIADNYDLYMGGKKLDKGAFVAVSLFGSASSSAYERMTGEICRILGEQLNIPADAVYVTYSGISDWGWNGRNL